MADQRMIQIAAGLLEKTRSGEIVWSPTRDEDVFTVDFPPHHLALSYNLVTGKYQLTVKNAEGRTLEEWEPGAEASHRMLEETFDLARRKALNVDRALDELLKTVTTTSSF